MPTSVHELIDYGPRTARYYTGQDAQGNYTFVERLLPRAYNTLNPATGLAKCRKCGMQGNDLSFLPECTTGAFGTWEKL